MFLRFKPTSHKKSPRLCKQSSRRTKKRGLIAGPHKILMRICSIFRRTTTPAEWTIFTARRRRRCHFLSKLSSWTRTLLWRMQIFQSRRVGCITAPTPCQRGVRKRVSTRTKRCDCNRTCRKGVSHSDSLTITATAITSALSQNLKLPGADCPTRLRPIWPLAQFNDVRENGTNQMQI